MARVEGPGMETRRPDSIYGTLAQARKCTFEPVRFNIQLVKG
jgi:hypothetical protein